MNGVDRVLDPAFAFFGAAALFVPAGVTLCLLAACADRMEPATTTAISQLRCLLNFIVL